MRPETVTDVRYGPQPLLVVDAIDLDGNDLMPKLREYVAKYGMPPAGSVWGPAGTTPLPKAKEMCDAGSADHAEHPEIICFPDYGSPLSNPERTCAP